MARSVEGENKVAVAFSGGIDSSVLVACARRHGRVVACTGHAAGSGDGAKGRRAAAALGAEWAAAEMTPEGVSADLGRLALPFQPTVMDRGLWCLYSAVSRAARASGARVMLLGQLADELFGGYAKYLSSYEAEGPGAAEAQMMADFHEYGTRGRARDAGACSGWVEARFPFEDDEITQLAWEIPMEFKMAGGNRKAVLRRAAVLLGVPEDIASAPKKAAQYSSGVQKLVTSSRF